MRCRRTAVVLAAFALLSAGCSGGDQTTVGRRPSDARWTSARGRVTSIGSGRYTMRLVHRLCGANDPKPCEPGGTEVVETGRFVLTPAHVQGERTVVSTHGKGSATDRTDYAFVRLPDGRSFSRNLKPPDACWTLLPTSRNVVLGSVVPAGIRLIEGARVDSREAARANGTELDALAAVDLVLESTGSSFAGRMPDGIDPDFPVPVHVEVDRDGDPSGFRVIGTEVLDRLTSKYGRLDVGTATSLRGVRATFELDLHKGERVEMPTPDETCPS